MKKLLLLVVTIMLTFSLSAISVRAATITPGTEIKNLVEGFTDSNSDGILDDWTLTGGTNPNVDKGIQKFYGSGNDTWLNLTRNDIELESSHFYYISYVVSTNASSYRSFSRISVDSVLYDFNIHEDTKGRISSIFTVDGNQTNTTLTFSFNTTTAFSVGTHFEISEYILIDLTTLYEGGTVPTALEFEDSLKVDYFSGTVAADQVLDFNNNTRVQHYMYDVPDIFDDFPNNISMENLIRVAFFIPLMIIYYLLIPLFNFILSGSVSGSIMLGLLILAFILREVIRFIDPDFHLFGKNSYYDGYKKSKDKD